MKKKTRNMINLIFSSFLVIGYIVCSYFFSTLSNQVMGVAGSLIQALILVVFGLVLFYATRVGEGKQIKRFSPAVLLLVVVPCVYIIIASIVEGLPFHDQLSPVVVTMDAQTGRTAMFQPIILMLACVGLGYGVPYTFLSGYETKTEEEEIAEPTEEYKTLEGGLAEELAQAEAEAKAEDETAEEAKEEAKEEAETETAEEAEEEAKEETEAEDKPAEEAKAEEKSEAEEKAEAEAEADSDTKKTEE